MVVDRILLYAKEGLSTKELLCFVENLMGNTSPHVRNNLYKFLETGKMPVTDDGCFLAYKGVTDDFKDVHTHKVDNSPGVEIKRLRPEEVDPDPAVGCSRGYHVGSYNYAKTYGPRLLACKVNPKDVISVPNDEHFQKCRVTYYEPLFECETKEALKESTTYVVRNRKVIKPTYHNVRDKFGRFKKVRR